MTAGALSRDGATEADAIILREQAFQSAQILGAEQLEILTFPDQRLDTLGSLELAKAVERTVKLVEPQVVYTHHWADLNSDHRMTLEATLVACRPLPGCKVRAVYAYEVQAIEIRSCLCVDVEGEPWARKMRALECYRGEMRDFPHVRSVEALTARARARGASVGIHASEAFEIVREIR